MSKYIDVDVFIKGFREVLLGLKAQVDPDLTPQACAYLRGAEAIIEDLTEFPAADVVEVRHGRWICINKRYGEYECSVCHGMDSNCSDYYGIHAVTEQEFCPSCGAKMDKEVADETCICQPWAEQT